MTYGIYYDSIQEGSWFKGLHAALAGADLHPFPRNPTGRLADVLRFDRPDIVLTLNREPVLVLERTVEVPSGHNVGQRFARLVAAAIAGVPCVYFGPYAAFKHGGETSGPRFMNLRLFRALEKVEEIEQSPVTTIRWPTVANYEVDRTSRKDARMKAYLDLFFSLLAQEPSVNAVARAILTSDFEHEQEAERQEFIRTEVARAAGYDNPPGTLSIGVGSNLEPSVLAKSIYASQRIALYDVGMRNIRSDPYTGMSLLYSYLYCGGLEPDRHTPLVLHFPNITHAMWQLAAHRGAGTKTIRLYRLAADAIIFSDGLVLKAGL